MKRARLHYRPVREESKVPKIIALFSFLYSASLYKTQDELVLARTLPTNAILNT